MIWNDLMLAAYVYNFESSLISDMNSFSRILKNEQKCDEIKNCKALVKILKKIT